MTKCQDPVWDADAMMLLLSPGLADPVEYLEVDVGYDGGMWAARVSNPTGYMNATSVPVPCREAGLRYEVGLLEESGWTAEVDVPATLLGKSAFQAGERLRGNILRWNDFPRNLTAWSESMCDGVSECNPAHAARYFGALLLLP